MAQIRKSLQSAEIKYSRNGVDKYIARYPPIEPEPHHPLIDLFRFSAPLQGSIFSPSTQTKEENIRPELGTFPCGSGASVTISSKLSNLQCRTLEVKGPGESTNFIDHTHTAWDREVPVAFKSVANAHRRLFDLATGTRVLCHLPPQRHPNAIWKTSRC